MRRYLFADADVCLYVEGGLYMVEIDGEPGPTGYVSRRVALISVPYASRVGLTPLGAKHLAALVRADAREKRLAEAREKRLAKASRRPVGASRGAG